MGNPSIGLAELGHHVDFVDADPNMCSGAAQRSAHVQQNIRIVCQDLREYLAAVRSADIRYDAILCLGNALGYQDSWPDRPVPDAQPLAFVLPTLSACREVLSRSGCLLIEAGLEPTTQAVSSYVRVVETPRSVDTASVWRVDCDPETHTRSIDTLIVQQPVSEEPVILGQVMFAGWLLTKAQLLEAARLGDLDVKQDNAQFRELFPAVVFCPAR
jgi:hypothetical protein